MVPYTPHSFLLNLFSFYLSHMNLYLPGIAGFIVFLFFFYTGPHQDWTQPNVNQTEQQLGQLQLVAQFSVIWWTLEGSSPTLHVMPVIGWADLNICTPTGTAGHVAWNPPWLPLQASPSLLYPTLPSSTSLYHTTEMQQFTLTLITGCLNIQTKYHQIQKLNPSWWCNLHWSYRWIHELIAQQSGSSLKGFYKNSTETMGSVHWFPQCLATATMKQL